MSNQQTFDFESLYARYPRKEGKKRGMLRLQQVIKTEAEYRAFATALDSYIRLCVAENRGPRYTKHFATFVNNWTDYLSSDVETKSVPAMQIERIMKGEL